MNAMCARRFLYGVGLALALGPTGGCPRGGVRTAGAVTSALVTRTTPPCEGEAHCEVVGRSEAGVDREGVPLFVVETARGRYSNETQQRTTNPDESACELREFWLERASRWEMTLTLCNDGYGVSGVGEDSIAIRDNLLVHSQMGGSAWRWSTSYEIQLFPRMVRSATEDGYWALGPNTETRAFDFTTFTGRVTWFSPACDTPDSELESYGFDMIPEGLGRSAVILPVVTLDAIDPSTTRMGDCATRVDATPARSFLVAGTEADGSDASFEVLVTSAREVVVVLHDDAFVAGSDRLDVHFGAVTPGYDEHCLEPDQTFETVAFDGDTGAVVSGDASRLSARAGRAPGGRFIRFALPFEQYGGGLTIAYSDADAPGAVERTFATSDFHAADPWSLGTVNITTMANTRCEVASGRLVRHHVDDPVRPLFEP